MSITIEIAEDGAMILPLQGAALGPETQAALRQHYRNELKDELEGDGRIEAWHKVARHPFFSDCYKDMRPLIESMIAKLDETVAAGHRPWHEAKNGEVWVVNRAPYSSLEVVEIVCTVGVNRNFIDAHSRWPAFSIMDARIVSAERIHPKDEV